ncbi:WXG100 family type VII secretion target [Microbacteriaceae bacterium VKM Ac-2854]|nr:WXG100 family type VII secretion target [Microbacteriaceae bacterium VKM Ac-2854]
MVRLGMDVEAVESAGRDLRARAEELLELRSRLESMVRGLPGIWEGPDARTFVNDWWPKHSAGLASVAEKISGLGQSALNNADEQRTASGDSGNGASSSSGSPSSGSGSTGSGSTGSGSTGSGSTAPAGPAGTQNYSASDAANKALAEIGSVRETGWNAEGECIKSVQRWINGAGGKFVGGGPVDGYINSGAVAVDPSQTGVGDVIQYTSQSDPNGWVYGVHTVMVVGVNADGTYHIVQSNSPGGSGLVSEVLNWTPSPPAGFDARTWRFAANP